MKNDGISYAPRGLGREESARYIGLSPTKFDQLIERGLMPRPKRVDGRTVWDRIGLDLAFSNLPESSGGEDGLQHLLDQRRATDRLRQRQQARKEN